jgi:hypothetical protein
MHRLHEDREGCRVTALPCPVRTLRRVTRLTSSGQEYQPYEWPFIEEEWELVGEHPGGIEALGELACSHCAAIGRMQSLELPPHPDGCWPAFREVCPLCSGPRPCVYDAPINGRYYVALAHGHYAGWHAVTVLRRIELPADR